MSTLSSASLKPRNKTSKNKVTDFVMTVFAVVFTLSPIAAMVILAKDFVDFSGAGSLVQEIAGNLSAGKSEAKER